MKQTVDAHHHLWDLQLTPQPWIDDSLTAIDRSFLVGDLEVAVGSLVDRTIVVQTVTEVAETSLLLEYAAQSSLVAGVVGWVDLTSPDVGQRLSELVESANGSSLVGIRHQVQGEADPRWLCRPDVKRGIAAVGEHGLVYELLTLPYQLEAAIEIVEALPEVSFVLDHLSKPLIKYGQLEPWASDIARLAQHVNVSCKLSGMVTEAAWETWTIDQLRPFAEIVIEAFGPERVMFGSDWPVCLLASDYEEVMVTTRSLIADLSQDEQAWILGGAAAKIFSLDDRPRMSGNEGEQ